jgi:hypothetical protein
MPGLIEKFINSVKHLFIQWPHEVEKTMAPVNRLLKQKAYYEAGKEIAKISLDICSKIENKDINPREADVYFTYLLGITDLAKTPLSRQVKQLILEGNALRDFGTKFGADLNRIKRLANTILREEI